MTSNYINNWLKDFWKIFTYEIQQIFKDSGVLLIFIVAGLVYPIIYNLVYKNGNINNIPIAVVDNANCNESREFINAIDATRECQKAYNCINMQEAEKLMQERKVNGIILFPNDFPTNLAENKTATISVYCDMSSFLYYKNLLTAVNKVMLSQMKELQIKRFSALGMSGKQADQLTNYIITDENNPYNPAFSYSIFLLSAILLLIIQQTMFYGMSMLAGTMREKNCSFASLPNKLEGRGVIRVLLGRGAAYWFLYLAISIYIAFIVPSIFGMPQRGQFWDVFLILLIFNTACVFFSMAWSSLITRRESVFVLFLFMSPICLFLTGTSWPSTSFPKVWTWFSYLFPTTFGCKAYINTSVAGGDLQVVSKQIFALTCQTIIYFLISYVALFIENKIIDKKRISND